MKRVAILDVYQHRKRGKVTTMLQNPKKGRAL